VSINYDFPHVTDMEEFGSHGQIERLIDRQNYSSWKLAMQTCLEAEDLWGCVLEDVYWEAQNTSTILKKWAKHVQKLF